MENSNSWFIYILRCGDNSLYTGITTNVERRLKEHQDQGPKSAKYVRGRLPLALVYKQTFEDRSEASRCEARIKKLSKLEKERLIKQDQRDH